MRASRGPWSSPGWCAGRTSSFADITEARRPEGLAPIPASIMESHSADGWAIKSYLPRSLPPLGNSGHIPRQGSSVRGGGERLYVPYTDFAGAPRGCGGLLHHPFHEEPLENLVPLAEFATPGLGALAATGTETLNVANPKKS